MKKSLNIFPTFTSLFSLWSVQAYTHKALADCHSHSLEIIYPLEKDKCLNVDNVCSKCDRQLGSKQALLEHLVREHRAGVRRKCPHCEVQFLTLAPLSNSRWTHPEQCPARPAAARRRSTTKSGAGHKICQECGGTYR